MSQPPGDPEVEALEYHQVLRAGRRGAGWPILGIFTMLAGFFVVAPLVWSIFAIAFFVATGSDDASKSTLDLVDTDNVTPSVLLFVNLILITAIPISWFCVRVFHGVRPRWLASVRPRIRWRWFLVCLGLSLAALFATVLVSLVLPETAGTEVASELNDFSSTTRDFVVIVLLLTPLQAAGEEYAFRGYLTQGFGSLFASPRIALSVSLVVPSLLFALAHGLGQEAPIFFDRFAFGLVAGALTILSGGLEAAIAMHVLNNWLAFGIALAFGDMESALNPTGSSWWSIPVTLTQSLVYLGLAVVVSRRMGLQTRTRQGILEGSSPRV